MTHPTLKICLMGTFAAEIHGEVMPPPRRQKSKWLLALLALRQGRPVLREWLAGTLWPDKERAVALYNLRQALGNDLRPTLGSAATILHATSTTLCLAASDTWVDVAAFDALIAASKAATSTASGSASALDRAVDLYQGPLLEGCSEEWVHLERAAREEAFHDALERLAAHMLADRKPGPAAGYLRRLIASSPLRESAYVALMEALAASGDAAGVREAYQDLRLLLHREMNAEPAAQTRTLYERLQQASRQPALSQAPEPAPASLPSSPPRRLPVPLTRLIGRESEITEVVDRFTQGRLVTLTGSDGVGKTRLSIAVAEAVAAEFADGVWLVELAALADPDLAVGTVAKAFQVKERPGQTILETLTSALSWRSLLLVLDNCEHLLDGCAVLVEELLRQCAGLRVLATSREALGLFGEWVYRVPSLEVPPLSECESGSAADKNLAPRLSEYAATTLFVERAAAQRSSLRLTASEALGVAEICSRLDGIPLAIEMAAARVRTMSIEEIRSGLSDRFRLLRSGSRTSLPRHQALRALLDWSYNLLKDAEKVLLRRLSVFVGGWTAETAEVVCSYEGEVDSPPSSFILPPCDVLDLLTSLMDKSLVEYQEREGKTRYRLLETVHQYGRDLLVASGEQNAVQARHLDYFLALAEEAERNLSGAEQAHWQHRLDEEHENLRAALGWSLSEAGSAAGLRLCGALVAFWRSRGHLSEGRKWCEDVLETTVSQGRTQERAKVLSKAGALAKNQADYISAQGFYELSRDIQLEIRDWRGVAYSLNGLGNVALAQNEYAGARALYEESLAICRKTDDRDGIASALNELGSVALAQNDYTSAQTYFEESLTIYRELGDRAGIAASLCNLGNLANAQGDYSAGKDLYEKSLAIFREIGGRYATATLLFNLGNVARLHGDYLSARALFEESLEIQRETGDRHGIAISLCELGNTAGSQGDYLSARVLFEESLVIRRETGDRHGIACSLNGLGRMADDHGDHASAHAYFKESLVILCDIGNHLGIAESLEAFAGLATRAGKTAQAATLWGAARALQDKIGSPLPPSERELYDRDVAKVRETLGEEAFVTAWEEGLAMTQEQAIEYALETPVE